MVIAYRDKEEVVGVFVNARFRCASMLYRRSFISAQQAAGFAFANTHRTPPEATGLPP
jgi:hypothetical protein